MAGVATAETHPLGLGGERPSECATPERPSHKTTHTRTQEETSDSRTAPHPEQCTYSHSRNRTLSFQCRTQARTERARAVRHETQHTGCTKPSLFSSPPTSPTDLPGVPLRVASSSGRRLTY